MGFHAKIEAAWNRTQSMLCVGLDPDPARMPAHLGSGANAMEKFCIGIIDATAAYACAFKPQIAYFAAEAAEPQLDRVCGYIRDRYPDHLLVLDAKRGDIGPTAERYARELFVRYDADVATVNPYMGTDSVEPYFRHDGKGVLLLCRTSNPGGDDFQSLPIAGEPLYAHVARRVAEQWSTMGECGLVVGATYPEELAAVRSIVGDMPILVPGIGAQGGAVDATVQAGRSSTGHGLMLSSSRAVLYASSGEDFAEAAATVAKATRDEIRAAGVGMACPPRADI